jgi:hypothetical protein
MLHFLQFMMTILFSFESFSCYVNNNTNDNNNRNGYGLKTKCESCDTITVKSVQMNTTQL